jgi:hypothetical protein
MFAMPRRLAEMTDDERKERVREILEEAARAAAESATETALTVVGATGISQTLGVAVFPVMLMNLIGYAWRWRQRAAAKWWYHFLYGPEDDEVTPEELAGRVEAHKDEPFVRETILRSVRALADSADDAAVIPLAVLAREYTGAGTSPDAFFRGTARLLVELSRNEISALRLLLNWVLVEAKRAQITLYAGQDQKMVDGTLSKIPYVKLLRDEFVGVRSDDPNREVRITGITDPRRLFYLLRINGLGQEGRGVAFDAGPGKIALDRSTIVHLRKVLGTE